MEGEPDESEAAAVAYLLAVHGGGRRILRLTLASLAEGAGAELVTQVAAELLEFLQFSGPLHELDEEQTVFPALRAHGPPEEVEPALADIIEEHVTFDELREQLVRSWMPVKELAEVPAPVREDLRRVTEPFVRMYERHAEHEERAVLPLLRKYVPSEKQAQMIAVMLNRRTIRPSS